MRIRGEYNTPSFTKADEPGGPIGTAFPVVGRIDISPNMKNFAWQTHPAPSMKRNVATVVVATKARVRLPFLVQTKFKDVYATETGRGM